MPPKKDTFKIKFYTFAIPLLVFVGIVVYINLTQEKNILTTIATHGLAILAILGIISMWSQKYFIKKIRKEVGKTIDVMTYDTTRIAGGFVMYAVISILLFTIIPKYSNYYSVNDYTINNHEVTVKLNSGYKVLKNLTTKSIDKLKHTPIKNLGLVISYTDDDIISEYKFVNISHEPEYRNLIAKGTSKK